LLGPLSNPAQVRRIQVGVFARQWIEPMARVLGNLGCERAWVVHGSDGLDEMTTTGPSFVAELRDGTVTTFEVSPEDAGLPLAKAEELKGDDAEANLRMMLALLDGETGPIRDIVLFNSAAALVVAGKVDDLTAGVALAAEAIDSGKASKTCGRLIEISNEPVPE
ncbi:MAG: anthranilate phosphoribosyltransferase, partial [Alphaproteobacteria bacterium]|nr:anthranilate phosphoribosyltransferase [Alphaproteobacteria bacterium]